MSYDAIIAGASFAGLAVATRIKGKVLLIDRKSIGALPISACATFYSLLKTLGCESSLLKVIEKINWQTSYNSYVYKACEPFCTFDYKEFCQCLFNRFDGEFLQAQVMGYEDGRVKTNKGEFQAPVVVDCTGWRATLASSIEKDFNGQSNLSFGLETVVPYEDDKLNFIVDPSIVKKGYAWIFPVDQGSRVGVGSMIEDPQILVEKLKKFISSLDVEMSNNIKGGYIPRSLRKAVVGKMFLVGDSAGQVFPLTAEGIRQSIYFGQKCASIIQEIINGDILLEEGLRAYKAFVNRHRWIFYNFLITQNSVYGIRPWMLEALSKICCWHWSIQFIQQKYYESMVIKPW